MRKAREPKQMRARFLVPLALFGAVAIGLAVGLTLQPQNIPSALIGRPVPEFALEPITNYGPGFATADLIGQVSIVNVFASWCIPCRVEHPLWIEVAESGEVSLFGLNYKDLPENASEWLAEYGNPYQRTGADLSGRAGMDWGVYGVPETFVVDAEGIVRFKHVGPIDRYVLENDILSIVRELQAQ